MTKRHTRCKTPLWWLASITMLMLACAPPGPGKLPPVAWIDHVPADGALSVANDTDISIEFESELLNATFDFEPSIAGSGALSADGRTATFTILKPMLKARKFTVRVRAVPVDPMLGPADVEWTFTSAGTPGADDCEWAGDDQCDEPTNCALGSDSTDCEAACEQGITPHLLGAACAHRNPPVEDPVDPALGTGGNSHLTGHAMGTIRVKDGTDLTKETDRHYHLYVPPNYDPTRPTPLVMMLPGNRVDIYSLADYTQLQPTAEANGFILVYAEQQWRWNKFMWSWFTDWDWTSKANLNPDIAFLEGLVNRIGEGYNIDRSRIYAVGHSRGASMSLIAAFELDHIFAGAAIQSGFTEFNYQKRMLAWPGRKMPLFFVHGVLDDDVCIDCGPGQTACAVKPSKPCGNLWSADALVGMLGEQGWTDETLKYHRLENVTHRWQPHLNQAMWDFLSSKPLPLTGGTP